MNTLAWALALSTLFVVMIKAYNFHTATVCRQNAWLYSTILSTRSLVLPTSGTETLSDFKCKLLVRREGHRINWRRFPSVKSHSFELSLKGAM
jgi:hypothetical protein